MLAVCALTLWTTPPRVALRLVQSIVDVVDVARQHDQVARGQQVEIGAAAELHRDDLDRLGIAVLDHEVRRLDGLARRRSARSERHCACRSGRAGHRAAPATGAGPASRSALEIVREPEIRQLDRAPGTGGSDQVEAVAARRQAAAANGELLEGRRAVAADGPGARMEPAARHEDSRQSRRCGSRCRGHCRRRRSRRSPLTPPSTASAVAQAATSTLCTLASAAPLAILIPSRATALRSTSEGDSGQLEAPGPSTRRRARPGSLPVSCTPAPLASAIFRVEPAPSPTMCVPSSTRPVPSR